MRRNLGIQLLWGIAFIFGGSIGDAQAQAVQGLQRCESLTGYRFSRVEDAATHIVSSAVLPATADRPAVCEARGYIAPQVQIVIQLPMEKWNGKLMVKGCGGFCGSYDYSIGATSNAEATPQARLRSAQEALRRGYAVTASNMGHYSTSSDAKWAYNNPQAEIDFGYRATHVNTLAAKAIVDYFYSKPAAKTYFDGCSTGGRQGLVAAQHYPDDFNGIIAGAPPLKYDTVVFEVYWSAVVNLDEHGAQILKPADVRFLHSEVLKACDAIDGQKDGIIDDPRACGFDPASLRCGSGNPAGQCLNQAQIDAARKIYAGPVDSSGRAIHVGGMALGSELNWLGQNIADDNKNLSAHFIDWMEDMFRYMVFSPDPGPTWTRDKLNWDTDPARARASMSNLYNATNPDLREFEQSGGKMIVFQGWADQQVVPETTYPYYEQVVKAMGSEERTQKFMELYMLPGVGHCRGGPGADSIDLLTSLENWVEKGQRPDRLLATHYNEETAQVAFTRPVFPYPDVARYSGQGDVKDAKNWQRRKGALGQPLVK